MKIIISGSSGYVGGKLSSFFTSQGNEVVGLVRDDFKKDASVLAQKLKGAKYVIHLAGAPVIKRWTKAYRKKIYDSRILTTRLLVDAIALMETPPPHFICASATGIYPEEGEHCETSTATAGNFLATVCRAWETEAMRAEEYCRRVLIFRFGVILGKDGGALPQMVAPFKIGFGGQIADGKQMMSWIHIDDVLDVFRFATDHLKLRGVTNICTPNPVSNKEFTIILAKVLHKPAIFRVPSIALRVVYGGGATVLTGGQKALPCKLNDNGYAFIFPELPDALNNLLSRS
jgi:uncharacterized protein